MKKLVSAFVVGICLIGSAGGVSAASTGIHESGGINLDPIRTEFIESQDIQSGETFTIQPTSIATRAAKHGGGTFSVVWGVDRHYSYYNHPKLEHRSSASNKNATVRSGWKKPGVLAEAWIKSTLTGNKANWATR